MLDAPTLRRLAERADGPILVDVTGAPRDATRLPGDAGVPGLLVAMVTEAVKQVEGNRVTASLDRDEMWAVEGFLLDAALIAALPDDLGSPTGLLDAVAEAGVRWTVIFVGGSTPL